MNIVINCLLLIVAYLIGSFSSAVFISKRFFHIDIREYGSKNAGATNILRVLGWKAALPVFIFDFLKGVAAVCLVYFTNMEKEISDVAMSNLFVSFEIALGIAVVLGHIFPIYEKFKGGKGVATMAGAVLAIFPMAMLIVIAIFVICLISTKYVSLSSIVGSISLPIIVIVVFDIILDTYEPLTLEIFSVLVAIMMIITHRNNIKRLRNGTESKINFDKKNPPKPKREYFIKKLKSKQQAERKADKSFGD
jgi:glycerol-3-phosphate acyltransferase PlsY